MNNTVFKYIFLLFVSILPLSSFENISIHPATVYTTHFINASDDQNEGFDNRYIDIEFNPSKYIAPENKLITGTLLNSQSNRCIILGFHKNWFNINKNLSLEGNYIYSGEFFFSTFEDCGDGGTYHTIKKKTGIGFVPFLYHGLDYKVSKSISLEIGNILPNILVFSLQIHF